MAAVLGLAAGCTDEQFEVMLYVNEDRSDANLELLQWDETLGEKAQAWAEHLARQGSLSHSNLSSGVPSGWQRLSRTSATDPRSRRSTTGT